MNQKLIALDLDGTTLNNDSKLSEETKETINLLETEGHQVVIATGRPYRSTIDIYKQLKLTAPLITLNGAVIHSYTSGRWASVERKIAPDLVIDIVESFRNHDEILLMAVETTENVWITNDYLPYDSFYTQDSKNIRYFDKDTFDEQPIALLIFTKTDDFQPIIQQEINARYATDIEIRTWGGSIPCLEVTAPNIHKAVGLEHVAHQINIPENNILAFGDEQNDYEMIRYADHGVAMSNGIPSLKNIANDITQKSNHDNGVATYLEHYFLTV